MRTSRRDVVAASAEVDAAPVAISATLGPDEDGDLLLDFTRTIFGEQLDASAVVGESLLTVDQ
ncbi:hypothetical protein [Corynebacterium uterequi]|uniref:Uncharacterized protein n=1 Tax=Corynebacterium uterequi TaxID=1072256 RepID=A0A0G3HEK3_9CORY|nr:hypothetical protein [Corynebacterium uterequi]AKK11135.1 hypothetical protein CUTER_05695 [Corynebacterium uterequi]